MSFIVLFGIAMITLKLWQLASLALPLLILFAGQVALMFVFTYFVLFNVMGRNYDAAVLAAGTFAVSEWVQHLMQWQIRRHLQKICAVSKGILAFVPIIGSMFADFFK